MSNVGDVDAMKWIVAPNDDAEIAGWTAAFIFFTKCFKYFSDLKISLNDDK